MRVLVINCGSSSVKFQLIETDAGLIASDSDRMLAKRATRCLRDLTRGGLSSALVEIALSAGATIEIEEQCIPVSDPVRAACELLALDPLYVANEGRFAAFVAEQDVERALRVLRGFSVSSHATRIGTVTGLGRRGAVTLRTTLGSRRPLDLLSGEQLPRIC